MTVHITLLASAAISLHDSAFTMTVVQFSVVIVCAFFLSSSSALDPHQLELKQHYEHLAYIADFPCLHPQPKVIPVHKLFSEAQAHGKAYFPDVTVLHRCDEYTGSCTSGHACSAKTSKLVLLPFKATYLEEIGKYKKVIILRFKFIAHLYRIVRHPLFYRATVFWFRLVLTIFLIVLQ